MRRNYVFMCLLALPFTFSCNQGNKTFVFKSDYCTLNNQDSYKGNQKVDLTLSILDEYKEAYVMPNDIEILLGNKTAKISEDYQYTISEDKKSASLSLTVTANVVVRVMYSDSDNIHRVTEEQFDKAMAMENIPYIQREYEYYRYYYGGGMNINSIHYFSPNIDYELITQIASIGSPTIQANPKYYEKISPTERRIYTYNTSERKWDEPVKEEGDIPRSYMLSPTQDSIIGEALKYSDLKNSYNSDTGLYKYKITLDNIQYTVTLSFEKKCLMSFSYETDGENGYLCYITYSYLPIVPELPPVGE